MLSNMSQPGTFKLNEKETKKLLKKFQHKQNKNLYKGKKKVF